MKSLNLTEQKGIASIIVLGIMTLMAVALPVTTKLVQNNQENRSKAAENNVNGVCGSANGISRYYFQISDEWLCEKGTATEPIGVVDLKLGQTSNVKWSCKGIGTGLTVNCSGTQIYAEGVDGVCGSANGSTLTTKPKVSLCIAGVADEVVDRVDGNKRYYSWNCQGFNGGNSVSCKTSGDSIVSITPTPFPITKQSAFLSLISDKTAYSVGQTFTATVRVNSGGNKITGVDGIINYDTSALSLVSATKSLSMVFKNTGDDCVINQNFASDKVSFTCYASASTNAVAVNGELVTLKFLVKKVAVSKIDFECTLGSSLESNIIFNDVDIIDCSKNINLTINGVSVVLTPTPGVSIGIVDGKCGNQRNTCVKGEVNDGAVADTASEYKWRCVGLEGGKNVDCSFYKTTTSIVTPTAIPIMTNEVSIQHSFAPKDYGISKIGSILTNDILIKTGGKKIKNATIIYCYTDLLKPDFNSVSGEQIDKVVSNKEIGNNCAELKVMFNDKQVDDPLLMNQSYTGYILSYNVTVVKYGKGKLSIDCSKSKLIDKNGKEVINNDPNCGYSTGTQFTLIDPGKTSPTPTAVSTLNRKITGKFVDLNLNREYLKVISEDKLKLWLSRLNMAYEDYTELTGWKPYNGGKITIDSVECDGSCMGWAWAGQSISWPRQWWQEEELRKINNNDDWSFGILHEMSHDFDNYESWGDFDNEMMANFKMAYFLEKRNAKVQPNGDGTYYIGKNILQIYKNNSDNGYDAILKKYRDGKKDELKKSVGNLLNYKFLFIKDSIGGWDTYKQVFRNLGKKKLVGENNKINAFLDEMTSVSKKDVRSMFNQEERNILELKFGKIFTSEVTVLKVDGRCGSSRNVCDGGTVNDGAIADTSSEYKWKCIGNNGGVTKICTIAKAKKINGSCGKSRNSCSTGSPNDGAVADTVAVYKWICSGSNGGNSVTCTYPKSSVKKGLTR